MRVDVAAPARPSGQVANRVDGETFHRAALHIPMVLKKAKPKFAYTPVRAADTRRALRRQCPPPANAQRAAHRGVPQCPT